ncbi:Fe-S cluster assembly sulfur transfer protein SufU [Thioalkalivibrio sp. HK1]|uniref:Fe-S cluster assembly sulfur transfer protein SufU n=1 Tax=Thioalkalivibrio sp. HK1 TaxID=1469245 RepID=UPI00047047CA|nr:SUF system NifU family Fe-S cluster assembly protein [Thioalkalivibrio sp. HK1]
MSDLRELYEEVILDHNRNPRNYPRRPEKTNHSAHGFNPVCGDEFFVHLHVDENGIIQDIGFDGAGCAISTASASLMTEALKGLHTDEVERLFGQVHSLLTEERQVGGPDDFLGKLTVLTGVKQYPMRVKCATLAWHTMRAAIADDSETVCTE